MNRETGANFEICVDEIPRWLKHNAVSMSVRTLEHDLLTNPEEVTFAGRLVVNEKDVIVHETVPPAPRQAFAIA